MTPCLAIDGRFLEPVIQKALEMQNGPTRQVINREYPLAGTRHSLTHELIQFITNFDIQIEIVRISLLKAR